MGHSHLVMMSGFRRTVADPRGVLASRIYYGWIIVLGCFLASMIVFGTTFAFGVFYDAFLETFERSKTLVAVVFGVQTALLYLSGVGVSRLVERYGSRWVLAVSSMVLVIGLVITARAQSYLGLLVAFGVVTALGMAGLYNVSYATLPRWFERRRGTATGLASAGLGIGLVVIPPGTDAAISAFGWRTAMLALAGFVALLSVLVVGLFANDPADVGTDTNSEFGTERIQADPGAHSSGDEDASRGESRDRHVRSIVTSTPFLLVLVGWTMIFAPTYALFGHVVLHASEVGIGRSIGVFSIAVIGITTTAGRIVVGPVSDRVGRPRTFVLSSVLLGVATALVAVVPTPGLFVIAVAIFGIGYAGSGGLVGAVAADLFGNRGLNVLYAVLAFSFAIGGLVSPPVAGLWFEAVGSYRPAFVAFSIVGIAGAVCVAVAVRLTDR